jgi:hypothetical protein
MNNFGYRKDYQKSVNTVFKSPFQIELLRQNIYRNKD